jgi:hypothetical protein
VVFETKFFRFFTRTPVRAAGDPGRRGDHGRRGDPGRRGGVFGWLVIPERWRIYPRNTGGGCWCLWFGFLPGGGSGGSERFGRFGAVREVRSVPGLVFVFFPIIWIKHAAVFMSFLII